MEQAPHSIHKDEEEIVERNGKRYKKVSSGYTVRQYFSHHSEKGPGPGWDTRRGYIEKMGYGVEYYANPGLLPDEPYYEWEEIEEDDE